MQIAIITGASSGLGKPNIDAAGACIGQRGMRIQSISAQLCNEKIDVIQYYKIPELFIAEALKPAIVTGVVINEEERSAIAIVANDDFSQAIGKKGQNVTLAARITDYRKHHKIYHIVQLRMDS